MKRIVCTILSIALLCVLCGCSGVVSTEEGIASTLPEQTVNTTTAEPLLDKFLEDWLNLLALQEKRLAQENYTLQLIVDIKDTPTWENYIYAQTACEYTCDMIDYLSQYKVEPAMTDADYQVLTDMGMDIGDVQAEYRTYNEITLPDMEQTDCVVWRDYYLQNLLYACFDENTLTMIAESAKSRYQTNLTNLQYWYLVNNYIVLELPEADSQKLLELATQNAPTVMEQYTEAFVSTTEVLNEINRVLNQQEACLLKEEEIITAWNVLLENPTFTPQTIENLPMLVRFPEFIGVDDWKVQHYWKEDEGIQTPEYLLEMDTVPNCVFMEAENVSLEAYQRYVLELKNEGLIPEDMNETAAVYVLPDGGQLMVYHEENTFSVSVTGGQACFAPLWYIQALGQRN